MKEEENETEKNVQTELQSQQGSQTAVPPIQQNEPPTNQSQQQQTTV